MSSRAASSSAMTTDVASRRSAATQIASGSPCSWAPALPRPVPRGSRRRAAQGPHLDGARGFGVTPGSSLAGYGDGEVRWEHQVEIRRVYGYTQFGDDGVEDELSLWLRARAWMSAESHRVLFARAAEHLIARRILLPGYTTLWRLAGNAREHADVRGFAMLADTPTREQRDRLEVLLRTPAGRRISVLERLRRPEVDPTIDGLIGGLERVRELRALADGLGGLDALPVARLRALTVDAERCRAADIVKMSDARRIATLIAFALTTTERGQDDALEQFDRLHGELLLRVRAQSQRERLADGEAIDAAGRTLMDACRIVLDEAITEPVRDAVFAAVQRDQLAAAVTAMSRLARSPDDRARELVISRYRGVRRYLPVLLDTITFLANDAGEPILDALRALTGAGRRVLTPDVLPMASVPRAWRGLVEPEPGKIDRAAYTMCALEGLRDALRRRDVYVAPSERYADARASLLGDAAWEASREDTQRSLSLPPEPGPFLEQLGSDLDDAYHRTIEGLTPEHPVHDLVAGELRVEQLDALPEPTPLSVLRERVDALMPAADLPDLVLEIAAKTGFIDAFTNDQEPGAQLADLHTSLCAVLVAQVCNVGYKPLVDESNPALREARLRYVAQRYLRPDTLAAANARIVDFHAKLGLAERWGGGEVASIDGLRFVVPRRTIHAAYNRRYFDRRRGVTLLGTTADHYAGLHTIVITGTQPDAPYILDGLLDPQTSVRPREIVTDTAGYTDVIFGLFRLLGYQYSPRLADAGAATFWRLNPTDYGSLNSLARHQINRALVEQHYDDLLRVAGSLLQRHTTASQLARAAQPHPPPRLPRQSAAARRARREDDPPPRLLQRPALPAAHPDPAQPRRKPPRPRSGRLPRPPRRTTPALPPRPRRTTRRARPDRQRDRPLQHDLHPTRHRPHHRAGHHDRRRRHRATQPARHGPHHPHRPVPNRAPRGATRPRRLPRAQHDPALAA